MPAEVCHPLLWIAAAYIGVSCLAQSFRYSKQEFGNPWFWVKWGYLWLLPIAPVLPALVLVAEPVSRLLDRIAVWMFGPRT